MPYNIVKKHLKFNFSPGVNILDALWGMVVHCTDDPGATGQNEFNYFNGRDRHASAHTFIDDTSITEVLTVEPTHVDRAWHAGNTANNHYIGVEMCMPKSHNQVFFKKVWNLTVWYFSYKFITILRTAKVEGPVYVNRLPIIKGNLMSHHEVSLLWKESTHIDPDAYFAEYGKTVNDFRNAVQLEIKLLLKLKS